MPTSKPSSRSFCLARLRSRPGPLAAALIVLGLLLWAKLLLVTNHPRTAIAQPSRTPGATAAAPSDPPVGAPHR